MLQISSQTPKRELLQIHKLELIAQPVIARSGSDEAIPKLIVFEGGRLLRYARNDTAEAILRAILPLPRYA